MPIDPISIYPTDYAICNIPEIAIDVLTVNIYIENLNWLVY